MFQRLTNEIKWWHPNLPWRALRHLCLMSPVLWDIVGSIFKYGCPSWLQHAFLCSVEDGDHDWKSKGETFAFMHDGRTLYIGVPEEIFRYWQLHGIPPCGTSEHIQCCKHRTSNGLCDFRERLKCAICILQCTYFRGQHSYRMRARCAFEWGHTCTVIEVTAPCYAGI